MTLENILIRPSRSKKTDLQVQRLKIISFTHKTSSLNYLGNFFIEDELRTDRLSYLKTSASLDEIFYLSTCNRVEFIFSTGQRCDADFLNLFFSKFNTDWSHEEINLAVERATVYEADAALHHIFSVASSMDSMVIGEREIITQVRKAYDECHAAGLTGDYLRLIVKNTITTAKQIFTQTKIASHPVSVVSLAYRRLRDLNVKTDSKIIMIGAGETNTTFSKYLVKHGFRNFSIFNRTNSNGEKLADALLLEGAEAKAYPLESLSSFQKGFDVLIACTNAATPVVTASMYSSLLSGDTSKKIIIDLGLPADIDHDIMLQNPVHLIDINKLKVEAEDNLAERHGELKSAEIIIGEHIVAFHQLLRVRKLELAMKDVPEKIREIKSHAIQNVFAKEISLLDENSKDLLGKILDYMEKKCISVPMLMAKEIILETDSQETTPVMQH